MIQIEKFVKILQYYAKINPYRCPSFNSPAVVNFWHQEFGTLTVDQMKNAMDSLMRKLDHFPSISDLNNELGNGGTTLEEDSREAAARIIAAVSRYGYNNPKEAEEYIGELGWHVVKLSGGWVNVCESLTNSNTPQLSSQYRSLALAQAKKSLSGRTKPPALPASKNPQLRKALLATGKI